MTLDVLVWPGMMRWPPGRRNMLAGRLAAGLGELLYNSRVPDTTTAKCVSTVGK